MGYNYIPYTGHVVSKIDIQFGQINNPLEPISVIPGRGFGEGSSSDWLQTCGGRWETNLGNI